MFQKIYNQINEANLARNIDNIGRRFIKYLEELGELSQAYLSVTGSNRRNLSWADFREEAVDCLILAVDLALTPYNHSSVSDTALIPNYMKYSSNIKLTDVGEFEKRIMEMARHITDAERHITYGNHMSFHGAMSQVIQLTSDLVFNGVDGKNKEEIQYAVSTLVVDKLAKWERQKLAARAAA